MKKDFTVNGILWELKISDFKTWLMLIPLSLISVYLIFAMILYSAYQFTDGYIPFSWSKVGWFCLMSMLTLATLSSASK